MVALQDALLGNVLTDASMNLLRYIGVFKSSAAPPPPPAPVYCETPLWQLAQKGGPWVRLAGLSGGAAVVLGAMGAHRSYPDPAETKEDLRKIFDTANRFHFLHSLALITVPLCRRPAVSGTLLVVGMTLFCGTCYYHAFTGDRTFRRLTPVGGTCLILGWLAMIGFEGMWETTEAWWQALVEQLAETEAPIITHAANTVTQAANTLLTVDPF